MNQNNNPTRDAFEKWKLSREGVAPILLPLSGCYLMDFDERDWVTWQAAIACAPQLEPVTQAELLDSLRACAKVIELGLSSPERQENDPLSALNHARSLIAKAASGKNKTNSEPDPAAPPPL